MMIIDRIILLRAMVKFYVLGSFIHVFNLEIMLNNVIN